MNIWIVEDGELILYKRTGKCNMCGECCRGKIVGITTTSSDNDDAGDDGDWSDWEGFSAITRFGVWEWWKFAIDEKIHKCNALKNNICSCHEDKPKICEIWPLHPDDDPDDVKFLDCGYSFRKAS